MLRLFRPRFRQGQHQREDRDDQRDSPVPLLGLDRCFRRFAHDVAPSVDLLFASASYQLRERRGNA